MNSIRVKIVISLIGMSIFSIALGSLSSRLFLSDRFQEVVFNNNSIGFTREIIEYYRIHGTFENAYESGAWSDHQQSRRRQVLLRPDDDLLAAPDPNRLLFIATDADGKVWIPSGGYQVGDVVPQQQLSEAIAVKDDNTIIGYIMKGGGQLRLSGAEIEYLEALIQAFWLSLFVVALVAIPLGILLGKRLTDPINRLSTAMMSMRPRAMYQSVNITSNDEIGLLSKRFNHMSEELAAFLEKTEQQKEEIAATEAMRRQAMVSISHELRTPLYQLVSQAYAMLDGIRSIDRNEVKKLADSLDHLTKLVKDFNDLSLSDVHELKCHPEPTDFSSIIRDVIDARKEDLKAKDLSIRANIPKTLILEADPTRLRQIIENLLLNCLRYANQGSNIYVELQTDQGFAELTISDSGPGVPQESLDILFDRFYRIESSRNRATGGTGLGLSLVKTCAEIHGGNAEAFNSKYGGLGIRVRIPIKLTTQNDNKVASYA